MNSQSDKRLAKAVEALESGNLREADKLFKKVLRNDPDCVDAHYLRGTSLAQQGDFKSALASLKQAASLQPDSPYILNNLGGVYQKLGAEQAAMAAYRKALVLAPEMMEAHAALGALCQKNGDVGAAETHYLKALSGNPNAADLYHALGGLCWDDRRLDAAERYATRAVELAPSSAKYRIALAGVLVQLGKLDAAEVQLNQAFKIDADSQDVLIGLADIKLKRGEYQAACDALTGLFESGRATTSAAMVHASAMMALGCSEEALSLCEPLLQGCDDAGRIRLCFMLGQLADTVQDYPRAFRYFEEANGLKAEAFDEERHRRFIENIKNTYTTENRTRLKTADPAGVQPIFIVGMPRSGTSLVEQILASHPTVYGAGERHEVNQFAQEIMAKDGGLSRLAEGDDEGGEVFLNGLQQRYLEAVLGDNTDAACFTDKMPLNYLYLGFVRQLFPNAKIVHCRRNPLDTCLSCYFSDFYGELSFANDLALLGRYYRDYHGLMAFWGENLDLPMLEVTYESLVENQRGVTEEILGFCDLPWDEHCMNYFEARRYVNTLSSDQVRQPIYKKAVNRHRNYLEFTGPLENALAGPG